MKLMRRALLAPAAAAAVVMLAPATALAGNFSVTPSRLDYGVVAMNVSAFQVVTVTDTGPNPLTIQGRPARPERSARPDRPGESCEFDTSWHAGVLGSWEGLWEVETSAGPVDLPITGFSRGASESHPGLKTFQRYGLTPVEKTIVIDAGGNADLHISSVGLGATADSAAASTSDYSIVSDDCTGATLAPGQRCAVNVLLSGAADAESVLWIFSDAYSDSGYPGHDGVGEVGLTSTSYPKLAIERSAVSTRRFSPRGRHGLPRSVVYSFRSTDPSSDTVQVVTGSGRVVRTWVIADKTQASVRWRGRNTNGNRVPPGRYTIRVRARFLGHTVVGGAEVVSIPTG